MTISMQRMTFGVLAVVLVGSLLASAPVEAQTADGQTAAGQVAERDTLIAAQENLLNTYRCMFGVDTAAVSGGCPDPDQVQPGAAPQNPSQQDIDARDSLIDAQENLLNTYRCQHNIDTQLVPGGCSPPVPSRIPGAGVHARAAFLSERIAAVEDDVQRIVLEDHLYPVWDCLMRSECVWTLEQLVAVLENMLDAYTEITEFPDDINSRVIDPILDINRELIQVGIAFSAIAEGRRGAAGFDQLRLEARRLLGLLRGEMFDRVETVIDRVSDLEAPAGQLASFRQAVDNARIKISEVLPLLG
ncbi:MAG: hypothetical protein OXT07_05205 [bacterium]|nr:hypothetical protein [bacterium]